MARVHMRSSRRESGSSAETERAQADHIKGAATQSTDGNRRSRERRWWE